MICMNVTLNVLDDLERRSQVKSNIFSGFLGHNFPYDGNTYCIYWICTGNNKGDIACFV